METQQKSSGTFLISRFSLSVTCQTHLTRAGTVGDHGQSTQSTKSPILSQENPEKTLVVGGQPTSVTAPSPPHSNQSTTGPGMICQWFRPMKPDFILINLWSKK